MSVPYPNHLQMHHQRRSNVPLRMRPPSSGSRPSVPIYLYPPSTPPAMPPPYSRPTTSRTRPLSFVGDLQYANKPAVHRTRCTSGPSRYDINHARSSSVPPAIPTPANGPNQNHGDLRRLSASHLPRKPSPLALPPLPSKPEPEPHVPVPCTLADGTLSMPPIRPLRSSEIWDSGPSDTISGSPSSKRAKLKKEKRRNEDDHEPSTKRLSFAGLASFFSNKDSCPTPNTLLLQHHYTGQYIPPERDGIRFPRNRPTS
ncbi:hypothetical protein BDZ97DRAFT_580338 [Flammula alnicola]|nr:hypothetical protein BDZ97DRAFT_580338 [Flammula alnicola]